MKKIIEKLARDNDKLITLKEKEIIKNYADGFNRIDKTISKNYQKYGSRDGKLYMSDMVKYDRLKKLEREVAVIIAKIYAANNTLTRKTLRDIMTKSYKTTVSAAGLRPIIKSVEITEEVNKLVAGVNWYDRNNKHEGDLVYRAHAVIKDGLEDGKTYNSMIKGLKETVGKNVSKPIDIIRTESHRIVESSKLNAAKDIEAAGVSLTKTWVTMADERVRSSHNKMDGKTVKLDDEFDLGAGIKTQGPGLSGVPDEDIRCRCILVYNIEQ